MKKIIFGGVLLALTLHHFLHHRRPAVSAGLLAGRSGKISRRHHVAVQAAEVDSVVRQNVPPKPSLNKIESKIESTPQVRSAAAVATIRSATHQASLAPRLPVAVNHLSQQAPVDRRRAPAAYAPEDEERLKNLAAHSLQHGSRVAYVGDVTELYAFEPGFFVKVVNAQGQDALQLRAVEMVENNRLIQREAYPVPPTPSPDYNILDLAIRKATDDGAMLINLASANVDRNRLTDSINYARNRGVVVVSVRPPGMK